MAGLASVENNFPYLSVVSNSEANGNHYKFTTNIKKNPRLSVYMKIFGTFYFDATPMASPGTKIIAHEKPNQRAKRSKHGVSGWYISLELEHYRCYKLFGTESRSEVISYIVEFPPQNTRIPTFLSDDADTLAAQYLVEELQKPTPNALFEKINDTHHTLLRSMDNLFNIIPKSAEQQSNGRNNGQRWERQ